MTRIQAREKALSFDGDAHTAIEFVDSIRDAYDCAGRDLPKMLNDFVFNIEVALQNAGVMDENFNVVEAA